MNHADLIARLEAASGPDRELDCALAIAVDGFVIDANESNRYGEPHYCFRHADGTYRMPGQAGDMLVPRYTASIDAAIALAERVLPEGLARLLFVRNSTPTKAGFDWPEKSKILYFEGATPAIALCIAILKAKEASNG